MSPFPRKAYRPLTPYAPDRRPIAIDLSDNTNRWGAHPGALRAVREADPEELLRYPPVYADRLREAVARRFDLPPESISTGCGSDDLLDSAFRAAGEPGEGVNFVPPTFSMIEIFARMNGLEPRPVSSVEALFDGSPALVYLCRPNNPTGESVSRSQVEALMAAADAEGPILLLDEAYADFADDDFLAQAPGTRRVVVLRTLSKVYGLAGLRVGFAVGAPEVIREIEKSRGPYKVNRLAEAAAVAALLDEEGWIPEIVAESRRERAFLTNQLEARGFTPVPSEANFVLVPLPSEGDDPAGALTSALRDEGVAVRPFPDLPGIGSAIRISVGPRAEMIAFLNALDRIER